MPSIFGNFFNISPKKGPWDEHGQDILASAMDGVAKDVELRLKSRLDVGISPAAAIQASTVTVRNEDGRLIISAQKNEKSDIETISDLFNISSNAPHMENNRLIFRQVQEEHLESRNLQAVRSSVEDAMNLDFKGHLDSAVKKIVSENPELS